MKNIRIATRKSPLALWQTEHVAGKLRNLYPEIEIEIIALSTQGDKILDSPLSKIGGKGLFVKELENSLLTENADIAVHSMKDVPMDFPTGLQLGAILKREDPSDAFVSNQYASLDKMPSGSIVGTSSLRRQAQLLFHYPELKINYLRGNVGTRLSKLDTNQYHAIILASAGLIRLGLGNRITKKLTNNICLPAIGQGAIGIECRTDDTIMKLLQPLHHSNTASCVLAERAFNKRLNGGCQVPIAGYAEISSQETLYLRGLVGNPNGEKLIHSETSGTISNAELLGKQLAEELLQQGADKVLAEIGINITP